MNAKKILRMTVFLFLFTTEAFGQTNPPPMAMPKDSNVILIDKILEVTKHKQYFLDYCSNKINKYARENNWSSEKTDGILNSVKFENYNSTIYNSYAFYSSEQLTKLLDALIFLNGGSRKNSIMVLTNSMMQNNLDLYVKDVIEGKYL